MSEMRYPMDRQCPFAPPEEVVKVQAEGAVPRVTIWNGIVSAAFVWLGFVATTIAVNNMFSFRRPKLSVIDGGHWLAVLLAMGIVIGAFGV